jgi:hypothetical protein
MKSAMSRSRASRVRFAVAVAAAATCSVFAVGIVPASALADVSDVAINEVESNGDAVHGDWIELYNTGDDDVDLAGAILTDSDPTHQFVIPAGAFLGSHDYIAFRVDDPAVTGQFGLGSSDAANLYAAGDVPGTNTAIDSYAWATHAATTYGATTPGGNTFATTTTSTFEGPNNFGAPVIGNIAGVKLNEVESNGDSTHGDWVELYNTTNAAINIDGSIITDSDPAHQFVVPTATPDLAAHGYVAFRVDDPTVTGNFGLGASDSAKLYAPNDSTLSAVVDQYSWTVHATVTYGRDVAGAGVWKPTSVSTFGAVNQFSAAAAPSLAGVVINEAESHGDDTHGDWIELKNTSGIVVTLDGAILSDNDNGHAVRIPASTSLAAGAVAAFRVDDPALPGNGFGLGDVDSARLFQADATDLAAATPVWTESWSTHATRTWGRNSSNVWTQTNLGTFGTANDFSTALTPDISDVVLNEVVSTGDAVHGDWVELRNTSGSTITIGGAIIADKIGNTSTIPTGTTLAAGATYVVQPQITSGWGLDSDDSVRLFRAGSNVSTGIPVDHFEWDQHAGVGSSYARQASGLGDWIVDTTPSYNAAN